MIKTRKKSIRCLMSLLLAAVMLVGILPISVFAESTEQSAVSENTAIALDDGAASFEDTSKSFGDTAPSDPVSNAASDESRCDGGIYDSRMIDDGAVQDKPLLTDEVGCCVDGVPENVSFEVVEVGYSAGKSSLYTDGLSPLLLAGDTIEYYGRSALAELTNADALLYAYDQIVKGINDSEAEINVYDGTNAITIQELNTVFDAYRRDHAEHFWLGNSYGISYSPETVLSLKPSYIMSGDALNTAKEAFENAISAMLDGITSSMSEYERELILHDRLAAKVSYDTSAANPYNAYGAVVEGKAVCEGYSEAFQCLLQRAGIQSFLAIGSSNNPSTGSSEGHEWNIVRIDGKYYHVDTTWDDQGEYLFHAYFNKTDTAITEDHVIDATDYALPECNSETADYFYVNGGRLSAFDLNAVAELLKANNGTASVYVTGDKTAFASAFADNISALAGKLGYSGSCRYGYSCLGREYILMVVPVGVTVSGQVTGFLSGTAATTIELWKSGSTEADYTTAVSGGTQSGNKYTTTYSFTNIPAGSYTMKVSKANHVTREYTVTVGTGAVTQDVEINLSGDINGDGKVTTLDFGKVNSHARGVSQLTGYELKCADVTGTDGKVTTADAGRINAHARGVSKLWG